MDGRARVVERAYDCMERAVGHINQQRAAAAQPLLREAIATFEAGMPGTPSLDVARALLIHYGPGVTEREKAALFDRIEHRSVAGFDEELYWAAAWDSALALWDLGRIEEAVDRFNGCWTYYESTGQRGLQHAVELNLHNLAQQAPPGPAATVLGLLARAFFTHHRRDRKRWIDKALAVYREAGAPPLPAFGRATLGEPRSDSVPPPEPLPGHLPPVDDKRRVERERRQRQSRLEGLLRGGRAGYPQALALLKQMEHAERKALERAEQDAERQQARARLQRILLMRAQVQLELGDAAAARDTLRTLLDAPPSGGVPVRSMHSVQTPDAIALSLLALCQERLGDPAAVATAGEALSRFEAAWLPAGRSASTPEVIDWASETLLEDPYRRLAQDVAVRARLPLQAYDALAQADAAKLWWYRRAQGVAQGPLDPSALPEAADTVFVALYAAADATHAFLVEHPRGIRLRVERLAGLGRNEGARLGAAWRAERRRLQEKAGAATDQDLVAFSRATMDLGRALWDRLVAPLLEPLSRLPARHLVFVPHGALSDLPLHMAWHPAGGEAEFLTDRFVISYAPSLSLLTQATRRRSRCDGPLLLVQGPAQGLAAAPAEHQAVRTAYAGASARVTEARHPRDLLGLLAAHDLLHFIGHGDFEFEDPLASGLIVGHEVDGSPRRLDLRRLAEASAAGSPLALVTLSACMTGVVVPDSADEAISLPTLFLHAGAASVVATLWPVADQASACFMEAFYRALAQGASRMQAFSRGVQSLRARPELADPFYWAAFQLMGDWR